MNDRKSRDLETREKAPVREVYVPPSSLPDPAPDEHYVYRWIASHILGHHIPGNMSLKMREGWSPVKAEDHPELILGHSNTTGNVEIGGLILCKMPKQKAIAREEYYQNVTASQMSSVDNSFMKQNDPRMPLFSEKKSSVSFGKGT